VSLKRPSSPLSSPHAAEATPNPPVAGPWGRTLLPGRDPCRAGHPGTHGLPHLKRLRAEDVISGTERRLHLTPPLGSCMPTIAHATPLFSTSWRRQTCGRSVCPRSRPRAGLPFARLRRDPPRRLPPCFALGAGARIHDGALAARHLASRRGCRSTVRGRTGLADRAASDATYRQPSQRRPRPQEEASAH
jgi:hypothetical protein